MDQELLVEQQNDGLRLVERLVHGGIPVSAAFWLKAQDGGKWYLYIASPVVEKDGLTKAYREVHALIRQFPSPFWVDPFEVKLIAPTDPLAQAVQSVHDRYPGRLAIHYGGGILGDTGIEDAFLYPPHTTTAGQ